MTWRKRRVDTLKKRGPTKRRPKKKVSLKDWQSSCDTLASRGLKASLNSEKGGGPGPNMWGRNGPYVATYCDDLFSSADGAQ